MVIDTTYFTGPLAIAQLSQPAVADVVETYIELHGDTLLSMALGESLKDAYLIGIDVGSDDPEPEQRWLNLRDGISFTDWNGHKRRWVGFDSGASLPINPVAAYVWFRYQRDRGVNIGAIGANQTQPENASVVAPGHRLTQIWNQLSSDIYTLWEYVNLNADSYPEFKRRELNARFFNKMNVFGI